MHIFRGVERKISSLFPHEHSADRRAAMEATKQQIDYYKTAKDTLEKETKANEEQKKAERQRINEKEIRARQRTYRRAGFMSEPSPAPKDTLG